MAKQFGFYTTAKNPAVNPVPVQMDGQVQGGNIRVYREVITLASQPAADTIVVAYANQGDMFLKGILTATATLGASATIAIGNATTAGKYRAAATFTTPDVPTMYGVASAMCNISGNLVGQANKLSALEEIIITIAVAALPSSGFLVVDNYFAQT